MNLSDLINSATGSLIYNFTDQTIGDLSPKKRKLMAFRLQAICQPFEWFGHQFARNISLFEWLREPFIGNINLFEVWTVYELPKSKPTVTSLDIPNFQRLVIGATNHLLIVNLSKKKISWLQTGSKSFFYMYQHLCSVSYNHSQNVWDTLIV